MKANMAVKRSAKPENYNIRTCTHHLSVELRSGVTVVNVKPLFSYDSQLVLLSV